MSITKSTLRRKKVTRQSKPPSPRPAPSLSRFHSHYEQKYGNRGVVDDAGLRHFLFNVPISHLHVYGARFQATMDVLQAAQQQPTAERRQEAVKQLAALKTESEDRRYRRILRAMIEAAKTEEGVSQAWQTAQRAVEITFEWSPEYLIVFAAYQHRLKQSRQEDEPAADAKPAEK
jgi:hypothetical protein